MNRRRKKHLAKTTKPSFAATAAKKRHDAAVSEVAIEGFMTGVAAYPFKTETGRLFGQMIGGALGEKLAGDPKGIEHALMQIIEPALDAV